ncbi:MAG: hypothetical protein HPY82_25715 [Gammaproteobacteria bacterium]|nr:hypothetical protein [Gammaproteobacteria bacterium]
MFSETLPQVKKADGPVVRQEALSSAGWRFWHYNAATRKVLAALLADRIDRTFAEPTLLVRLATELFFSRQQKVKLCN